MDFKGEKILQPELSNADWHRGLQKQKHEDEFYVRSTLEPGARVMQLAK